MRVLQNIVLLFGLCASVLFGFVLGISLRKTEPYHRPKNHGYTLIECGKGINQDGDTVKVIPTNSSHRETIYKLNR